MFGNTGQLPNNLVEQCWWSYTNLMARFTAKKVFSGFGTRVIIHAKS
jgi:hypothetical protein